MSASLPLAAEPEDRITRLPLLDRALFALDWPLVVEALVERAATRWGADLCREIAFFSTLAEAETAYEEVRQMWALIEAEQGPSLGGIADLREALTAVCKGEILDGPTLLAVAHSLEALDRLRRQLEAGAEIAPRLADQAQELPSQPDLASWLLSSFDARGELSTSAYPQLRSLRTAKARLHENIRRTLEALRREDRYDDALQDDFVALRNDRYVLPVKVGHKRQGLGIVHDASGSGQTVFVEPYEVIESNNELKMAEAELEREERRILDDLSRRVERLVPFLRAGMHRAAQLDAVQARVLLGQAMEAVVPRLSDQGVLDLKAARHPVLVLAGGEVVPNDLTLGEGSQGLVLSGPNTGGKTVTLKTAGLMSLMVRCALPLPVAEGSCMGWFPTIATDIGDSQDVGDGLSTFSGHVLSLVEILQVLDADLSGGAAMVLVDEIAAGTDPVQGAALGRAVLGALLEKGALVITTTHYPELKALSTTDPRFKTAQVGFDSAQGIPTYMLEMDRAGGSHALDVAAQVGMDASILEAARSFLDPKAASLEELLGRLEEQVGEARRARDEAAADRKRAEEELEKVLTERDELLRRSRDLERELRAEFNAEVEGYRAGVRGALKQMDEQQSRQSAERARQRINEGAAEVRDRLGPGIPLPQGDAIVLSEVRAGDWLRVGSLARDVTILSGPDSRGRFQVEAGGLKVQVAGSELERARSPKPDPQGRIAGGQGSRGSKKGKGVASGKARGPVPRFTEETKGRAGDPATAFRSPDATLDLRGQLVDEALEQVDRFLDASALGGREFAFLLHGHGTGALKKAVRGHLRASPYVRNFAPGTRSQGGDGITVVAVDSGA